MSKLDFAHKVILCVFENGIKFGLCSVTMEDDFVFKLLKSKANLPIERTLVHRTSS